GCSRNRVEKFARGKSAIVINDTHEEFAHQLVVSDDGIRQRGTSRHHGREERGKVDGARQRASCLCVNLHIGVVRLDDITWPYRNVGVGRYKVRVSVTQAQEGTDRAYCWRQAVFETFDVRAESTQARV